MTEKVVNLFGNQQEVELTPEQSEIDAKLGTTLDQQNALIREMVTASYKVMDETALTRNDITPLVHMPIEASFSLASTYLSVASEKTKEDLEAISPIVQELSIGIDEAIDKFYIKHGDDTPSDIMYYALINVALNALLHERSLITLQEVVGQPLTEGVTN